MIEYLFFNEQYSRQFLDLLRDKGVDAQSEVEAVQESICIKVSENIEPALWHKLDEAYETLSEQDILALQDGIEEDESVNASGIYIQLADNKQTIAQVDPVILNKILSAIDMDELNSFIGAIVDSVEKPDDSPICQVDHSK